MITFFENLGYLNFRHSSDFVLPTVPNNWKLQIFSIIPCFLFNSLLLLADKDFSFSTFIFWHSKFLLWPLQQNVFGKRGGCFCRWVVHSMQIRVACKIDKSFLKEIYLYSLHHMHSKRWSVGLLANLRKSAKNCKEMRTFKILISSAGCVTQLFFLKKVPSLDSSFRL